MSVFFALGAIMASVTGVAFLVPGSGLGPIWRLNPQVRVTVQAMGSWAVVLMVAVAVARALSVAGLWIRARSGAIGWASRF